MKKTLLFTAVVFCLFAANIVCAQTRFEASIERGRVSEGNPVYMYLTFHGSQSVEKPDVKSVEGLQIKYIGPSTKITVVNGVMSQTVTHTYLIIPLKEGVFTLGPFYAEYKGNIYPTDILTLNVGRVGPGSGGAGPQRTRVQTPSPLPGGQAHTEADPYVSERVFLKMDIGKRLVYMNESVPLTIKLYVTDTGLKDIEYPVFEHEGFSSGEFIEPERKIEMVGRRKYEVLIFKKDLYAIKEGNYFLGPVKLKSKMVIKRDRARRHSVFNRRIFDDDFFGFAQYETYPIELVAEEIPVTIMPLPEEARPEEFQGAVGTFSMEVFVDKSVVNVGDPVVVKSTISGMGDLDTVTSPRIQPGEFFKSYEPQVTKKREQKNLRTNIYTKDG